MDEPKQEHEEQAEEQTESQENEQDVEGHAARGKLRDAEEGNPKDEGEGAFYRWSDRRFKREVQPLSGALARLTRLR